MNSSVKFDSGVESKAIPPYFFSGAGPMSHPAADAPEPPPRTVEELAELFARHRDHLRRMVQVRIDQRLAQRVDASDVVQEAYLAAQKRLVHAEKMEAPPLVWLRQITQQTLVDLHRQHVEAECRAAGREVPLLLPPGMTSMIALAEALAGDGSSPSSAARRDERRMQLAVALDQLEPTDREILLLRHFEELGNKEVAELLGLQQTAASNRYFRALQKLKQIVAAMPDFSPET